MLQKELISYIISFDPWFDFERFKTFNHGKYKNTIDIIKNSEKIWYEKNFKEINVKLIPESALVRAIKPYYVHIYSDTIHGDYYIKNSHLKYFYGFLIYSKQDSLEEWYELPDENLYKKKGTHKCPYKVCECQYFATESETERIKSIIYKGNYIIIEKRIRIKNDSDDFDTIRIEYFKNTKVKRIYDTNNKRFVKEYYTSGNLRAKYVVMSKDHINHKIGCEKQYFDSSDKIVQRKLFYVRGMVFKELEFSRTGKIYKKSNRYNDCFSGKVQTYFPSGNIKSISYQYSTQSDREVDFYFHGKITEFYDIKNKKQMTGIYQENKKHGTFKYFTENGEIIRTEKWVEDVLQK